MSNSRATLAYGEMADACVLPNEDSLLRVELVENSAQLDEFIRLPRKLYAGKPGYHAPLDAEQRDLLHPKKSSFFKHGVAAYFLARRAGKIVGRISAQVDTLCGPKEVAGLGQFGCFDMIDDADVAENLFRAAESWLAARGCNRVRGPFSLTVHGEAGTLLEGQMEPPMVLFPWHPCYLAVRIEQAGYRPAKKLFCFALDLENLAPEKLQKIGSCRPCDGFEIRDMRRKTIKQHMMEVLWMFNDAWSANWGFAPASEADAQAMVKGLKPFLLNGISYVIHARGEPAAFAISIPNVCEITSDLGPRPSWCGWMKLAYRIWRERYQSFQVVMLGVLSKHHGTMLGARVALKAVTEAIERLQRRGARHIATGWVLEDNLAMLKILRSVGFEVTRTYAVYEKSIG